MPNFRAISQKLKTPDGPYYGYGGQYGYGSGSPFGRTRWLPLMPGAKTDWEGVAKDIDRNAAVAICLGWKQDNFNTATLEVGIWKDPQTFEPLEDHGVLRLLGPRGKPCADYSRRVFWSGMILSWHVDGNAFAIKGRGANGFGDVNTLWWEPHFNVTPWHDPEDTGHQATWYYISRPEGFYRVPKEKILHIRDGIDKFNPMLGFPRLKATLRSIVGLNSCETYMASAVENMGGLGAVWSPEGEPISPDEAIELGLMVRRQTSAENSGKMLAMTMPGHFDRVALGPQEMALDTIPDRFESTICAAMGINPMVVGLASGASQRSYANQGEADRQSWNNGLIPMQDAFAEGLEAELLLDFPGSEGLSIRWNRSAVTALSDNADAKATRSVALISAQICTKNEARAMNGLPPIEGGDEMPKPVDETDVDDEGEEEDGESATKGLFGFGKKKPKEHWITTDEGKHMLIGGDGTVLRGGAHIPGLKHGPDDPKNFHDDKAEAKQWGKEHYGDLKHELTKHERTAIKHYQSHEYRPINAELRGQSRPHSDLSKEQRQHTVKHVDSVLQKSRLPHDVIVHRGVSDYAQIHRVANPAELVGSHYHDKGYVSTSLIKSGTSAFAAGNHPLSYEIHVPAGSHAAHLPTITNRLHGESEMLLPRNSKFKITGHRVEKVDDGDGGQRDHHVLSMHYLGTSND